MSGGYFDYDQNKIDNIVEKLESLLSDKEQRERYGLSPITLTTFMEAITYLKVAKVYAQRIDWLLSADDSEKTFHERLNDELGTILNEWGT